VRTFTGSARSVAVLLAAALVSAACTLPGLGREEPDPPSLTPEPAQVRWRECPEVPEELVGRGAPNMSYECATIAVPRDWAAPEAPETFEISLIRARSEQQTDRIGSLIINPGGPGASGVDTAVYLSFGPLFGGIPDEISRRFDIVGFDPRGVSRSTPVKCFSDADLDESFGAAPDPDDADEFAAAVALVERVAAECGAEYGDALGYYSTEQTAHDMDAVRAAVGDEKITYLGYSYGTLLGATYAQLYPDRIRALVLDGAIDPREDLVASSEGQAAGFELAFTNFAEWCADTPDECPLAPDARGAVTGAIERGERSPVTGDDGRTATAGWVFWAVVATLYAQDRWPVLAAAIDQLEGGDPSGVFELADSYAQRGPDGSYTNLFDANTAVNCADEEIDLTTEQVRDLQGEWREKYPLFGAPLAIGLLTCAAWPAVPDPYPTGPAEGAPPIVVVGTTGDPATPYEQAPRLAEMLGTGVLLTWDGEGHTAYPETECIADAVNAYVLDLAVPPEGTVCPAS